MLPRAGTSWSCRGTSLGTRVDRQFRRGLGSRVTGAAIVEGMPRVSAFYGVVIYMYWNERDHPVAHLHAYHAGRRASVSADGDVLAGSLDLRALQFVREWAVLRRGEILANWERARRNEPLLGIDPLA